MSDQPSPPECSKCKRPGILVVQYVMPNKWDRESDSFLPKPWVYRGYFCRYHLAAENHPRMRRIYGGTNFARKEFRTDEEMIAEWESKQPKP